MMKLTQHRIEEPRVINFSDSVCIVNLILALLYIVMVAIIFLHKDSSAR